MWEIIFGLLLTTVLVTIEVNFIGSVFTILHDTLNLVVKEFTKPSVKKALWGGQFWTDGYYVAIVGERGEWSAVERYLRNQDKPREELRQLKLFMKHRALGAG